MRKEITSLHNPHIKEIIKLKEKKRLRNEAGLMIVDGFREILCAKTSGIIFKEIYICPEFFSNRGEGKLIQEIEGSKAEVFDVTKEVFSKIAFGDRKEGLLAICQRPKITLEDIPLKTKPLLVVIEAVEKPGNLGAILRICDSVGVDGVLVCDEVVDNYNHNVIRASLGAIFSVKIVLCSNEKALDFLKKNNIMICATSAKSKNLYTQTDLNGPVAFILGSEQNGLSDFWMKHADRQLKIPMRGKISSLNISAATAVLLYETLRQKNQ